VVSSAFDGDQKETTNRLPMMTAIRLAGPVRATRFEVLRIESFPCVSTSGDWSCQMCRPDDGEGWRNPAPRRSAVLIRDGNIEMNLSRTGTLEVDIGDPDHIGIAPYRPWWRSVRDTFSYIDLVYS
jgi:hypothetical protein